MGRVASVHVPFSFSHRIAALIIATLFVLASYHPWTRGLDELLLGAGWDLLPESKLSPDVAVVEIDAKSIERFGPWPWPRARLAQAVDRLSGMGARGIGLLLPLDGEQTPPELQRLARESQSWGTTAATKVRGWVARLDNDGRLARALSRAGDAVLSAEYVGVRNGSAAGAALDSIAVPVATKEASAMESGARFLLAGPGRAPIVPRLPVAKLAKAASGVGVIAAQHEAGPQSGTALALSMADRTLLGFVTYLAALANGVSPKDIEVLPGGGITLGDEAIATGPQYKFYPKPTRSADGRGAVSTYAFTDLWDDKSLDAQLRGRTVIIGLGPPPNTGTGPSPEADASTPARRTALALSSLLAESYATLPAWFFGAQRLSIVAVATCLVLMPSSLIGRVNSRNVALACLALLAVAFAVLLTRQLWLPVALPGAYLLAVQAVMIPRRKHLRWLHRHLLDAVEAHRRLASQLHTQGQLDAAFEQYRKCPPVAEVLTPLYQLGLDFEGRRQLGKAIAVYEYAAKIRPSYKDVKERLQSLKSLPSATSPGAGTAGNGEATVLLSEVSLVGTTLAHYRLEREIGRGAMAVVYLATDSKLQRPVAVKALSLGDEYDGAALAEASQRFRREAEAAARLNHPNIVTVYEAGDDGGLAYIAMDYVPGDTLEQYTDDEDLLPVEVVLEIGARVADALDYAHANQVVHRDVKPSNILYDPDSGTVKVTDFGIACLTDTSRTQPGTVLGTPSYMSPEQAAGKKVDGRSDLFSLGVTLYQLLTGHLPFVGDSLANLIYRITTQRAPALRKLRPELHTAVSRVIHRSLQKEPAKRFATAGAMSEALERTLERLVDAPPARRRKA